MGRPLFGSNLHSASCHCQSCVFPPLSDPGSSTATLQQPPSLSEPPFADRDTAITSSPPFQPSPLPWSSFDLSPATRNPHMQQKETNSLRVRSSIWSPFAGR
ncbi:hypothetical protein BC835DRAFT_416836 [Cytidiella melzeri]|nr:hypothetical protein BC835DRAFT_416836 [Cytidiella melzeri]